MYEDVGYLKNFHYADTGTEQIYLHRLLYHQAPTFFLAQKPKPVASALRASWGCYSTFLAALTSPEQIYQHQLTQLLIQILEITDPSQLLLPLTIIFVIATLIAATVRLLLLCQVIIQVEFKKHILLQDML